ncbi:MAG TPA: STAS domain-containing protein [Gemmataceae bacterium]|jgi:anti-sigma B factor antagonist
MSARSFEVKDLGDVTVVHFRGNRFLFDMQNLPLVSEDLHRLIEEAGRCRFALDLGNVVYLFSDVLGMFIALHKRLQAVGGQLTLFNVREELFEIFHLTQLDRILEIRKDTRTLSSTSP